jgi:glycosyltransferase involved in cell wall biosynthesis
VGDRWAHPWKYLRREIPHRWYVDERHPLMGFLNRDEATLLHNIALPFAGKPALEIGSWLGWSTCHLALAGVTLDVIDPAHDDPAFRAEVEESLARCGVADRVHLAGGRSPDAVSALAALRNRKWSLFFIDGDHEGKAPRLDALNCLPHAAKDCAFVFHDLASPDVAAGLRALAENGFHVLIYQTAQIMGIAWRGEVKPVRHTPDPDVAWQLPQHLVGLPVSGFEAESATPAVVTYREFADVGSAGTDEERVRPSVCIVSNEIIGPFKNGGIGTAMTGLAEMLAGDGHPVTFLYTGGVWSPDIGLTRWRTHYAKRGITLVALTLGDMSALQGPLKDRGFGVPYLVYLYLSTHPFDVVHFNDCCGEGSLVLAAKELGAGFQATLLTVALHSPSQWVLELNQTLPTSLLLAAYNYAERLSVRCADVVWSPSRYLAEWAEKREFRLPAQTYIQQYLLPAQSFPAVTHGRGEQPEEIVFFGRLEERKGLRLFCNAIHLLRDELERRQIKVTFLGKPVLCAGMGSLEYIERRAKAWNFPVTTITGYGQPEAVHYLRDGTKLAVMPSPFDNSPCTVYEALSWGIPFLAARTGGIPELVHEADQGEVLFEYTSEALRAALLRALDLGGWIARPALEQAAVRRGFSALHAHWRALIRPRPSAWSTFRRPVTAIVDHRAGLDLTATLASLASCAAVRRIVVLDRSGERAVAAEHGDVRHLDLLSVDPEMLAGELEDMAGDAVLLVHSGVSIIPDALDPMLRALEADGVDGLLPAARIAGDGPARIVPPLGGSPAFSAFEGVTFTGAMLVRSEALFRAREGRTLAMETPFLGLADFSVTRGTILPYPLAALEWSEHHRVETRSPLPARISAYDEASPTDRYYMLATGYGALHGERPVARKREVALALVNLGLGPMVRLGSWGLRRARGMRARMSRWMR